MGSKKILIIEDEETIADILSYSLKQEGYNVEIATDGKKGLELVNKFLPDMISNKNRKLSFQFLKGVRHLKRKKMKKVKYFEKNVEILKILWYNNITIIVLVL